MSRHNRPVTSSYCAKKTKTTNKHFISLLVQEMHCVIIFFCKFWYLKSYQGSYKISGRFRTSFKSFFFLTSTPENQVKEYQFKKSSNTSKYFHSRTWGLKSTYWAVAYTRDYVAEWDCFLSTTFFKSPRLSPENNRRVTGYGGENINRLYIAVFYRKLYELIRRLFPCLESCAALGKCWLSWSSG